MLLPVVVVLPAPKAVRSMRARLTWKSPHAAARGNSSAAGIGRPVWAGGKGAGGEGRRGRA